MLLLRTVWGNKETTAICWERCLLPGVPAGLLSLYGPSSGKAGCPPILTATPSGDISPRVDSLPTAPVSTHSLNIRAGDREMKDMPFLRLRLHYV